AVLVVAQHPAGSPAPADGVALVPDEHRRQPAVEHDVARIEIVGEQAAPGVRRDDHADGGKFFVAELADLTSRRGHRFNSPHDASASTGGHPHSPVHNLCVELWRAWTTRWA